MSLLLLLLFTAVPSSIRAHPLDQWHWRNPLPQGNGLMKAAWLEGQYISVGISGTILTSSDGTNWMKHQSSTYHTLRDVAYGNGRYVVVGSLGTTLSSEDAIQWNAQHAGSFYTLRGIAFGAGRFVAVGDQSTILTSVNGIDWDIVSSGPIDLFDVAYGNGLFMAVGNDLTITSTDGFVWDHTFVAPFSDWNDITFGQNQFVMVGRDQLTGQSKVYVTKNGDDPDGRGAILPVFDSVNDVSYVDGQFYLSSGYFEPYGHGGSGMILASPNALDWSIQLSNEVTMTSIAGKPGHRIASTFAGTFLSSTGDGPWRDPFANHLTDSYHFRDLTYDQNQFVGITESEIWFSWNGHDWTNHHRLPDAMDPYSILYADERYWIGGAHRLVWSSPDGTNWIKASSDLEVPYTAPIVDLLYANHLWLAVPRYDTQLLSSTDGTNWTAQRLTSEEYDDDFQALAYGNGTFVATGGYENLATSKDGLTWTNHPPIPESFFYDVAFGQDKFVAVGQGIIAYSENGIDWTIALNNEAGFLKTVAYGDGYFVAAGGEDQPNQERAIYPSPLWISSDGIHWISKSSGTARPIEAIASGQGTFVLAGAGLGLLQSDPMVSMQLEMNSPPRLTIHGPAHRTYRIEYSPRLGSLVPWSPLTTLTPVQSPFSVVDTEAPQATQRYYRAVLLP